MKYLIDSNIVSDFYNKSSQHFSGIYSRLEIREQKIQ